MDIPAVFLAMKHKRTPIPAKITATLTVCYALSPVDLIPDSIPVLGYLDDIILLPGLVAITIKLIPSEVFRECQDDAKELWANGKPKKWYFAIPVILLWLVIISIVLKKIIIEMGTELLVAVPFVHDYHTTIYAY